MTCSTNMITKFNAEKRKMEHNIKEILLYQSDLEGIIKRQHLEMDNMRDELKNRGGELNNRNVIINELKRECNNKDLSVDETNVKISILMRKVREKEEEVEYYKCVA